MPIYKMEGKRDGLQRYRVRINYTDKTGKARQLDRVAYGKEAAKQLEERLNREVKPMGAPDMTLTALYEEYIETRRHEIRENTLRAIRTRIEPYILPELGFYTLRELTVPLLQRWKSHFSERTRERRPDCKISLMLKQDIYGEFRTLLNYAVRMEYIPKNPLTSVGNFKNPYEMKKEMKYYTPEQFTKFITFAREEAERVEAEGSKKEWEYYVFFNIAFFTGMRRGEICALKWSDIDGDIIHVRRNLVQKINGGDMETPTKSTTSMRDLQMPQPLIKILKEHRARHEKMEGFSEDFRICGGTRCVRTTTTDFRNKKYSQGAGLERIRVHDFRHSHASLLANNGINIQEIARRLGHADIEVTWKVYAHLYPREEERAVTLMNKLFPFV